MSSATWGLILLTLLALFVVLVGVLLHIPLYSVLTVNFADKTVSLEVHYYVTPHTNN